MRRKGNSVSIFYMTGVAGLFLAGFLMTVLYGAGTYRNIAQGQADNNRTRALLSYLSTCVKSNGTEGAVRILQEGDAPILTVDTGGYGYALRIYLHDGELLEDYGPADSELNPEYAAVIGETDIFRVEEVGEGLWAIVTDEGRVLFCAENGDGIRQPGRTDER